MSSLRSSVFFDCIGLRLCVGGLALYVGLNGSVAAAESNCNELLQDRAKAVDGLSEYKKEFDKNNCADHEEVSGHACGGYYQGMNYFETELRNIDKEINYAGCGSTDASTRSNIPTPPKNNVVTACQTSVTEAQESCAVENESGWGSLVNMTQQITNNLSAAASMSAQVACSQVGSAATAANAVMASFKANCGRGYSSCSSVCSSALSQVQADVVSPTQSVDLLTVRSLITQCNAAGGKMAGIDQQIAQVAGNSARLDQCKKMLSDNGLTLAQCQANPSIPGCSAILPQDCNNPSVASTNLTCVCIKSPNDSRCGGINASRNGTNNQTGIGGAGSGAGQDGTGAGLKGDISAFGNQSNYIPPDIKKGGDSGGGDMPRGGGGAGMAGGSRGANEPPQKQGPGGPGRKLNANIYSGKYGSTMGAGSFGAGGGSGAGGAGGYPGYMNGRPQLGANGQNVDLRKFLPGGHVDPRRALAGATGPDGITGPYSNIWHKINNRYFSIRPTLRP